MELGLLQYVQSNFQAEVEFVQVCHTQLKSVSRNGFLIHNSNAQQEKDQVTATLHSARFPEWNSALHYVHTVHQHFAPMEL